MDGTLVRLWQNLVVNSTESVKGMDESLSVNVLNSSFKHCIVVPLCRSVWLWLNFSHSLRHHVVSRLIAKRSLNTHCYCCWQPSCTWHTFWPLQNSDPAPPKKKSIQLIHNFISSTYWLSLLTCNYFTCTSSPNTLSETDLVLIWYNCPPKKSRTSKHTLFSSCKIFLKKPGGSKTVNRKLQKTTPKVVRHETDSFRVVSNTLPF